MQYSVFVAATSPTRLLGLKGEDEDGGMGSALYVLLQFYFFLTFECEI